MENRVLHAVSRGTQNRLLACRPRMSLSEDDAPMSWQEMRPCKAFSVLARRSAAQAESSRRLYLFPSVSEVRSTLVHCSSVIPNNHVAANHPSLGVRKARYPRRQRQSPPLHALRQHSLLASTGIPSSCQTAEGRDRSSTWPRHGDSGLRSRAKLRPWHRRHPLELRGYHCPGHLDTIARPGATRVHS